MKPKVKRYLEDIYYDPSHPGSYSGVDKLYRAVRAEGKHKISRKKLEEFLKTQETYGVHRKAINRFPRPRVITSGVGIQAEADLADMSTLAPFNDQFKFVLVHIDIFSKYVRTVPLKSKTAQEVTSAFKKIFADGGKTQKIRTDRGGEFVNKTVQALFRKEGIKYFTSSNITKCAVVERAIKTLKTKYFKYMTQFQTFRYIDIIEETTRSYNRSFHRSIRMRPADVSEENQSGLFTTLYGDQSRSNPVKPFKYKPGDHVRVSFSKRPFSREYEEKWSYEIFRVESVERIQLIPVYTLQDLQGETLVGRFYTDQLQPAVYSDEDTFKIEKILKSRKLKGRPKEYLVKWMHWPAKFNSWVSETQVEQIKKRLEEPHQKKKKN